MHRTFGLIAAIGLAAGAIATPPPAGGTSTTGSGPQPSARPPQRPVDTASAGGGMVTSPGAKEQKPMKKRAGKPR